VQLCWFHILGHEPIEHRVAHWATDMHVYPTGRKQCVDKNGFISAVI
jgi:hypothetical protein